MNAHSFDTHSPTCPICHHPTTFESPQLLAGLLTCPHCRARLVVSWSGHYVRDPFTLRHLALGRALRRESHPVFRILRDLGTARSALLMTALAGAALIGLSSLFPEQFAPKRNPALSKTVQAELGKSPRPH